MNAATLITAYYDAFNRGDHIGAVSERARAEAISRILYPADESPQGQELRLRRMDRCYRERLEGIRVIASADGSHAAAEYVVHGEYLADDEGLPPARGQRYVLPGGAFFDVRDGKIARVTNYYNLDDWIAQVGGKR